MQRTPIELTDDKKIIEIFQSHRIRILDSDLIDQLFTKKVPIGEGATSTVYKVANPFTNKGYLSLKVLKNVIFKANGKPEEKKAKSKSIWDEEEDMNEVEKEEEKEEEIEIDFDKVKKLYSEYELLFLLNHPNIVKTFGFYFGDKTHNPAIALEYCKFNLGDVIGQLEDFELVGIIYEICSAMKHLHENKIIHRDLKMANILVNLKKHVKICDFGIAKSMDLTTYTSTMHGAGTLAFMAPELFKADSKCNEKVDVYSFGVVMFFIVTKGQMPTFNPSGYESVKLPKTINKLSQGIIRSCWSTLPDNRPSFDEILKLIIKNKFLLINGVESKIPQLKEHLGI